jgi:flagellar motor switch/type III secretory pathway protein FliN
VTEITEDDAKNPAPALRPELRNWCEAWKTCLQDVLSQVSGQPNTFEVSPQSLPAVDSDLWYTVVAGGAAHGEMALRVPAACGTRLARKFLGEIEPAAGGANETPAAEDIPGEEIAAEAVTAENKEALEELLRQIAGLAATALGATAGGEVQLHLSASAAPSWSSDAIACLRTKNEAGASIALEIHISPALAVALQPRAQAASTQTFSPRAPASSSPLPPASNYGRLMDVGLDVKLRFGTRRMLLREVLALSAGAVVELDNALHSPVDFIARRTAHRAGRSSRGRRPVWIAYYRRGRSRTGCRCGRVRLSLSVKSKALTPSTPNFAERNRACHSNDFLLSRIVPCQTFSNR